MRDAVTQNRRRKERSKLGIFCKMETVTTCSMTDGSGSCHGLAPSFFDNMTRCWHQNLAGDDQATLMVDRISQFTFVYISKIATNAPAAAPRLLVITQSACCRCQTHHRRWTGNPNCWSKFHNVRLLTLARSQLMLRQWLRGWRQLTEIVQMARCGRQKCHQRQPGDDQDRSKFRNYKNLCLRDQAKPLEKHLFAVMMPLLWWHCTLFFFSTITHNSFCSHLRKIISWRSWPPPKNRDIHIEEFFLRLHL